MKIQIINGPNLNLLGIREPGIYGHDSFDDYLAHLRTLYPEIEIDYYQSNVEGYLIDRMQEVGFDCDGIVLNAGAYTHTSVALHDCIRSIQARGAYQQRTPARRVPPPLHDILSLPGSDSRVRTRLLSSRHRSPESQMTIDQYIRQHIDPEGDYLYRLWRATNIHTVHGRMASGHLQGRLLKMLVEMIRPQRILEVGTFSGYSAICMAEGLGEGGKVYTFEINDEMEDFTRQWIEGSPVADRIDFRIGDANVEAPRLGIMFDMAFVDGDKRTYRETFDTLLPIIRQGGYIIADNTLWDGHVVDPAYANDSQTHGIDTFNDYIARDTRVEKVILPIRDGLTIIRKK